MPKTSYVPALVEVEEATGKVEVVRVASAHDVGRALNPVGREGQIEGVARSS